MFKRLAYLVEDKHVRLVGEVPFPLDQSIQGNAVNKLLGDIIGRAFLEVVVYLHDMVVIEVHELFIYNLPDIPVQLDFSLPGNEGDNEALRIVD